MTVASIHQNSFVVNVEWSVKFSCSTCTSFLIQNFTIFKKLYCSQHSSEFICRECRMVRENFLVAHALLFYNFFKKTLFALFLSIHETPYPSFSSLSSKRDHKEMEQEDDEMMEETDKKIKNVRNTCIKQVP